MVRNSNAEDWKSLWYVNFWSEGKCHEQARLKGRFSAIENLTPERERALLEALHGRGHVVPAMEFVVVDKLRDALSA